jgi:hypothetical protein
MTNRNLRLPVLRTPPLLPPGSIVRLRRDPSAGEGVVEGRVGDKLVVNWRTQSYTGRHWQDQLTLVRLGKPPAAPLNPYERMLLRIDEANKKP